MRSPYWLFLVLLLLLGGLQYRLWVGNGSLAQVTELKQQIAEQHAENERLLERNRVLDAEVLELKKAWRPLKSGLATNWDGQRGRNPLPVATEMIETLPAFWAVIPTAGVGARMAADRPKQYLSWPADHSRAQPRLFWPPDAQGRGGQHCRR